MRGAKRTATLKDVVAHYENEHSQKRENDDDE